MNNEETTSPQIIVENKDDTRIVSKEELAELAKTEPLHTVVRVKDDEYKHHILLDDINGNKFWGAFSGDKDYAIKSNEWFKKGQSLFEEKPLTAEESSELKECLLAISTLGNYFQWDPETVEGFLDQLIVTFAQRLYCKHKSLEIKSVEDLQNDQDFMVYINATAIFVKMYADLVKEIHDSVQTAADEQTAVDKSV